MLDLLYAQAVAARRRWYERHPEARRRLTRPVISVGNLSVGGTGKTPMVRLIARWLIDRGERPAILSRGYGRRRRSEGVVLVSDGDRVHADLDRAGDEPLMLAHAVTGAIVAVSEDRYLAGVLAERHFGATVHVLDDGFQHVQLARDLDVLMTTLGEISGGRVLPLGRLRESIDAAARAHLLIVVDTDAAGARAEAWTLGVSQSAGARRVLVGAGGAGRPASAGGAGGVVAVAGTAHPARFFDMLRQAEYPVAATIPFADHHRYGRPDIARIENVVKSANAAGVVTTEKDFVRLDALAPLPFPCTPVPMTLEVDSWETVASSIDQALLRAREAA